MNLFESFASIMNILSNIIVTIKLSLNYPSHHLLFGCIGIAKILNFLKKCTTQNIKSICNKLQPVLNVAFGSIQRACVSLTETHNVEPLLKLIGLFLRFRGLAKDYW